MTTRLVAVIGGIGATSAMLRRYAATIEDLADLPTHLFHSGYSAHDLPADVRVVLLVRTEPGRTRKLRDSLAGRTVITDQDTTTIALTAELLTTLTRAGRAPEASRVVVAGADAMPSLSRLLLAAGIGDITTWNPVDALAYPLERIAARTDAVVDLVGAGRFTGSRHAGPAVITPDHRRDPLLALPGLLRAITADPAAPLNVDVQHACALALAAATPPGKRLPHEPDEILTRLVADAASRAPHPAQVVDQQGDRR